MKRKYTLFFLMFGALTLAGNACAVQTANTKSKGIMPASAIDCKDCHTCDVPTAKDMCLKQCPTLTMTHTKSSHSLVEAPDSLLINELAEDYEAVHFNHKQHAGMAEMNDSCGVCHHYSPPGHIPPCKECHLAGGSESNLRQPGLKGAYHRQCLSCHREWSHDTKCVLCHIPNVEGLMNSATEDPTDIIGKTHPVITEPEYALLLDITDEATPDKLWVMKFATPSPNPDEITSTFGRMRSYNGSEYVYYHSGLDYRGFNETPIFAPAPGVVVYTGELPVRGNTTIISHGWGVYTGYWHQSRIEVAVGDTVQTGQTIGYCGDSGRATGPHLHFDLLVGGVEVDPEDWIYGTYAHVGN